MSFVEENTFVLADKDDIKGNFINKDGVYGYWGGYGVSSATIKIP